MNLAKAQSSTQIGGGTITPGQPIIFTKSAKKPRPNPHFAAFRPRRTPSRVRIRPITPRGIASKPAPVRNMIPNTTLAIADQLKERFSIFCNCSIYLLPLASAARGYLSSFQSASSTFWNFLNASIRFSRTALTSLAAAGSSGASSITAWSWVTAICNRVAPSSNERAAS